MCLSALQQFLLPRSIGYGLKAPNPVFKYLNASVVLPSDGSIHFLPYNANASFASGASSSQTVARCRPNLGTCKWSSAQLRSYVRQRLAVHRQVVAVGAAGREEKILAADRLIAGELKRLGYTAKMLVPRWEELPPQLSDGPARILRSELRTEERRLRGSRSQQRQR